MYCPAFPSIRSVRPRGGPCCVGSAQPPYTFAQASALERSLQSRLHRWEHNMTRPIALSIIWQNRRVPIPAPLVWHVQFDVTDSFELHVHKVIQLPDNVTLPPTNKNMPRLGSTCSRYHLQIWLTRTRNISPFWKCLHVKNCTLSLGINVGVTSRCHTGW